MSSLDAPNVTKDSDTQYNVLFPTGHWIVSAWTSWTKWDVMWLPSGASMFAGYPNNPVHDWEAESFTSAAEAVDWCQGHPR